jgi:hypothetical protein
LFSAELVSIGTQIGPAQRCSPAFSAWAIFSVN